MQHANIARPRLLKELQLRISESPAVAILGARQVGKTTLAKMFCADRRDVTWFDLEVARDFDALSAMPEKTLGELKGLVVLDEVQTMPDLFRVLRPLCDREGAPARFLLLGRASPELVRGVSETLAGRVQFLQVGGFTLDEVGAENQDRLWLRGGFPRSYVASDDGMARRWREGFVQTFLERDIPKLGLRAPAPALRRFWSMAAHYHGQVLNIAEMARAMGVAPATARHYLDTLCGAYVMRLLPPWYENLGKRQVKSPKLYVRDSAILHDFLGIFGKRDLLAHPRLGVSWEGFALEQILARIGDREAYFWATHRGAELDLLLLRGGRRYGFEFKANDAPKLTPSMRIAVSDLKLDRLWVIHPAAGRSYCLDDKIEVMPLTRWSEGLLA